jgi:hypothetical protein
MAVSFIGKSPYGGSGAFGALACLILPPRRGGCQEEFFPEDMDRGYGPEICAGDIAQGYGPGIWPGDMRRGYSAGIWTGDMARGYALLAKHSSEVVRSCPAPGPT